MAVFTELASCTDKLYADDLVSTVFKSPCAYFFSFVLMLFFV
jgi:hypothetical protein